MLPGNWIIVMATLTSLDTTENTGNLDFLVATGVPYLSMLMAQCVKLGTSRYYTKFHIMSQLQGLTLYCVSQKVKNVGVRVDGCHELNFFTD